MGSTFFHFLPSKKLERALPLRDDQSCLRIAQVSDSKHLFAGCEYFPPRKGSGLEDFQPQALVGNSLHLLAVAEALTAGHIDLSTLDHFVFLTIGARELPAAETVRRKLWNAFRVPVSELLLNEQGMPVACECQAGEGWHALQGFRFTRSQDGQLWFHRAGVRRAGFGLKGTLQETECACGVHATRITKLHADLHDPLRAA